jgi:hypothetical protein
MIVSSRHPAWHLSKEWWKKRYTPTWQSFLQGLSTSKMNAACFLKQNQSISITVNEP